MNWTKVIEVLNREAAVIAKRLEARFEENGTLMVRGDQRLVDLQTMQLCNIMAQALQSGVERLIPEGVYWDQQTRNFYSKANDHAMNNDFYLTWKDRCKEFPVFGDNYK